MKDTIKRTINVELGEQIVEYLESTNRGNWVELDHDLYSEGDCWHLSICTLNISNDNMKEIFQLVEDAISKHVRNYTEGDYFLAAIYNVESLAAQIEHPSVYKPIHTISPFDFSSGYKPELV